MDKTKKSEASPIFSDFVDEASEPLSLEILQEAMDKAKASSGIGQMIITSTPTRSMQDLYKHVWEESPSTNRRRRTREMLRKPDKYPLAEALYGEDSD